MNEIKRAITIRPTQKQQERVSELTEKYRVPASQIIDWALEAFIEFIDIHQGKLTLPIDFTELPPQIDTSSNGSHEKNAPKSKPA
jgi:hypothetical protein